MQFIDVLRMQSLNQFIQVEELFEGRIQTRRTGIMKVGNMKWEKIRHFEYKNVCEIVPCCQGEKRYLFVQVNDKDKCFYHRG